MSTEIVGKKDEEHNVFEICINRSQKKNALSNSMYHELADLLARFGGGDACNSIILYGANNCFTAGADLKDFQAKRPPGDSPAVTFLRSLSDVRVPVIAAVEGFAVGIGTTLLQHCDFVYATRSVKFRLPFVSLGLCPEGASSLLLERIVGLRKSRDWLMTCRVFDGEEAFDAGFVTALAESGETLDCARKTASTLSGFPQNSIQLTKEMLSTASRDELKETFDTEARMYRHCLSLASTQEIIRGMGASK